MERVVGRQGGQVRAIIGPLMPGVMVRQPLGIACGGAKELTRHVMRPSSKLGDPSTFHLGQVVGYFRKPTAHQNGAALLILISRKPDDSISCRT